MHCYRCGRRVPDRSPRCENCGQKFSYGVDGGIGGKAEPPPVVVPPPPVNLGAIPPELAASGLSESIFEVSQTSSARKTGVDSGAGDPTVPARMALHEATEAAIVNFGDREPAIPLPEPTDPEANPPGLQLQAPALAMGTPAGDGTPADIGMGTLLSGRLEIVAELGSGPLGRVFKAIDRKKGSVVAVKAIPATRLPEAALSGRFGETINLVKSLVHPNLAKVYGAGREGDTAFTIEQYLEGLPLRALLDVKKENGANFTFEEAEPIIAQICQGLSFAHAALVHGGIKPENVILHVDSLKIVDLGLARLFSTPEWYELQMQSKYGGAYLAPEYAKADAKIDRRADVYSVGAILYEMLTSRPPTGPDSAPVSSLNPSVPRAVDRVVSKAMARLPEQRFDTAGELKEAVFRVLGGDILADDLESPVGDVMETFVDVPADEDGEPGIEIEYLEPGPMKIAADRDSRDSEDATPVGAIALHEPLWEPDEIAEARTKSDGERKPRRTPVSDAPNAGAATTRELFEPKTESPGRPSAHSAIAPTAIASARKLDPPSRASDPGLGHGDHLSVDVPMEDGPGGEATATGMGPDLRPADWLDVKGPVGAVDTLPKPANGAKSHERELDLHEGSPLELELPAATEAAAPEEDGPTIRRTAPIPDAPRRPGQTPPPWDYRNNRPAAVPIAADRPTDPVRSAVAERPTAPRPRIEENPSVRALSQAVSPALDLSRPEAMSPDRPTDDRAADRAIPAPPPRVSPPPRRIDFDSPKRQGLDAPTSPPRPTFVVRRQPSNAPWILLLVVAFAGAAGGGWWWTQRPESTGGFVPGGAKCAKGMIWYAPGVFSAGSEKLDPDRDVTESIIHKVSTEGFCIDRFEFPNREGEAPRVNVTIAQADAACAKEGKRLCSENEWERACKGPDGTRFPYGDTFQSGLCNVGTTDKAGAPRPAGTFTSCGREDGPRDMSGNVWELTSSPWPDDPAARVIKGGSAKLPPWGARCSYRDSTTAAKTADDVGFRCCTAAR